MYYIQSIFQVVTHGHLVVCNDEKLECYDFKGIKKRSWNMKSIVRYLRVSNLRYFLKFKRQVCGL